jgi:hypothetical protein
MNQISERDDQRRAALITRERYRILAASLAVGEAPAVAAVLSAL